MCWPRTHHSTTWGSFQSLEMQIFAAFHDVVFLTVPGDANLPGPSHDLLKWKGGHKPMVFSWLHVSVVTLMYFLPSASSQNRPLFEPGRGRTM
jgi:hypothetical protein